MPIPLSDLVRFLSVAPKRLRHILLRPCASARAIRWLYCGWLSPAWRRTTLAGGRKRSRGFGERSRPTEITRMRISCWAPPSRILVDLTRRVPRSGPLSRSTRPSPSPGPAPPGRRGATTRHIWPGSSAFSRACEGPESPNNDRRQPARGASPLVPNIDALAAGGPDDGALTVPPRDPRSPRACLWPADRRMLLPRALKESGYPTRRANALPLRRANGLRLAPARMADAREEAHWTIGRGWTRMKASCAAASTFRSSRRGAATFLLRPW